MVDISGHPLSVEFGMELDAPSIFADPEGVMRFKFVSGQEDGIWRQDAHTLGVDGECRELCGEMVKQRVDCAGCVQIQFYTTNFAASGMKIDLTAHRLGQHLVSEADAQIRRVGGDQFR